MSRSWTEAFRVSIPECDSGKWSIRKFTVSEADSKLDAARSLFGGSGRFTPPGSYTRLMRGSTLVMSDTPDEIRDHHEPYFQARNGGPVLIAGLGLGCVTQAILRSYPDIKVTVVEISEDVINMVGPALVNEFGDRLEIIHADIFKWIPPKGVKYSVAWFDVWDDICADNLESMTKLKRKFGKKAAWKGCWAEYLCRRG